LPKIGLEMEPSNSILPLGLEPGHLEPDSRIDLWDRKRLPSKQENADRIPREFSNAMKVRVEVFVDEQGWPLEDEVDDDDVRACHWVLYQKADHPGPAVAGDKLPVATLRLVPFPHHEFPVNGGVYVNEKLTNQEDLGMVPVVPKAQDASHPPGFAPDRRSCDIHEPYVQLGRSRLSPWYPGHSYSCTSADIFPA
jgi:hypothetical protein